MPGARARESVRREQILEAAFEVAARDGLGGVTIRAVAREARVSHALVIFHFKRKEQLLEDLLGWLLENTSVLHVSEDIARFPRALDRLHALLQQEMARLAHESRQVRLIFEYWALGTRNDAIRVRISREMERYRAAFRGNLEEVMLAEQGPFEGITAEAMAAFAVSLIQGCAVQAMIDPLHFDTDVYLSAVHGVVDRLADGRGRR